MGEHLREEHRQGLLQLAVQMPAHLCDELQRSRLLFPLESGSLTMSRSSCVVSNCSCYVARSRPMRTSRRRRGHLYASISEGRWRFLRRCSLERARAETLPVASARTRIQLFRRSGALKVRALARCTSTGSERREPEERTPASLR